MINERFYSEDYPAEYYTEIIDREKKLDLTIPNPQRNLTLTEVVDLLNELNQEAKDNEHYHTEVLQAFKAVSKEYEKLLEENEELKKEVEMLRNGLKAYDEALPLYLDCEDIMHFNSSELFEFKMERMDFYKKYPNRVHYK